MLDFSVSVLSKGEGGGGTLELVRNNTDKWGLEKRNEQQAPGKSATAISHIYSLGVVFPHDGNPYFFHVFS